MHHALKWGKGNSSSMHQDVTDFWNTMGRPNSFDWNQAHTFFKNAMKYNHPQDVLDIHKAAGSKWEAVGELVRPYQEWLDETAGPGGVSAEEWAAMSAGGAANPGPLGPDPGAMVAAAQPSGPSALRPKRRSRQRKSPPSQAAQAQQFDIGAALPDHLQPRSYNDLETNRRSIEQYLRNIEGLSADGVRSFMQNLQADVAVATVGA